MIGIAATFVFVYAMIWLFERKRRQIEPFEIALIVVGPAIVSGIVRFGFLYAGLRHWAGLSAAVLFAATTFVLLVKPLAFPVKRAVVYTGAVFAFNLAVGFALAALTRKP